MSATPDDIELHKLVGTALDFELELVQVEREGSYKRGDWELSWEEKAAAVPALKESGNAHFKRGDALAAEADYMKALGFLEALKLAESEMQHQHHLHLQRNCNAIAACTNASRFLLRLLLTFAVTFLFLFLFSASSCLCHLTRRSNTSAFYTWHGNTFYNLTHATPLCGCTTTATPNEPCFIRQARSRLSI